jgi:hypothetical protein
MNRPPPDEPMATDPFDHDESIPLLTEVVAPGDLPGGARASPAAALGATRDPEPSSAAAASSPAAAPSSPALEPAAAPVTAQASASRPDARALAELAARIEHGVTSRMLEQAGPLLEASLQSMVAPLIEQAAVQIAQDLHDAFSHLVRDLVARAVAEELALLHARDADALDAGHAGSPSLQQPERDAHAGLAGPL